MKLFVDLIRTLIFDEEVVQPKKVVRSNPTKKTVKPKVVVERKLSPPNTKFKSKRDEIQEALDYMKAKKGKTKRDKESIYILEMVLKNMR